MAEEKKYLLSEVEGLRVLGRTTVGREPLVLFWTGSGFAVDYDGTELWCEFETDYACYEQWVSVIVNGALLSRQMLPKGRQKICLFRNMQTKKRNHVKVLKEVQPMPEDEAAFFGVHALYGDGDFFAPEEPSCRIEFIGDSITSGEGSYGSTREDDWIAMWFSATHTYPYLLSERLGAEYRVVSQSGYGVCCAWNNNPENVMPAFYEQICGVLRGGRNERLGVRQAYDFTAWQPDYIVINLGTNDAVAFDQPEWYDAASGLRKKMQRDENGLPQKECLDEIRSSVTAFLFKVRRHNAAARIFWCYGMMGDLVGSAVRGGVSDYQEQSGDERVHYIRLEEITGSRIGARCHPGLLGHQAAAEALYEQICASGFEGK